MCLVLHEELVKELINMISLQTEESVNTDLLKTVSDNIKKKDISLQIEGPVNTGLLETVSDNLKKGRYKDIKI